MAAVAARGGSKEEQDALLAQHQKHMQTLLTKMEADKLRSQVMLICYAENEVNMTCIWKFNAYGNLVSSVKTLKLAMVD